MYLTFLLVYDTPRRRLRVVAGNRAGGRGRTRPPEKTSPRQESITLPAPATPYRGHPPHSVVYHGWFVLLYLLLRLGVDLRHLSQNLQDHVQRDRAVVEGGLHASQDGPLYPHALKREPTCRCL